jgi:PAS domain S-box-containing protein
MCELGVASRVVQDYAKRTSSADGGSVRVATALRLLPGFRRGIGWRLLVRIVFFSSAVTLLLTLMQLYFDYRRDVQAIDLRMSEIDSVYSRSLGDGLWRLDTRQLRFQVEGILHLPDISYVELRETTDRANPLMLTAGSRRANAPMRREIRISYADRGPEQLLGILLVEATFEPVYRHLLDTAVVILISQGVKTFLVSFFMLLIVHRLVTRHLTAIAASLREYDLRGSQEPLRLNRHPPRPADELDHLVGAFNQMYAGLQVAYGDLQEREAKVRRLFESNIIGIVFGNPDGHVQEANQAFLRIVGYDQADVAAGRLRRTELTPPEWHNRDARALAEMRKTGTVQPFEKEYFRKDGSRVPVLTGGATLDKRGDTVVVFALDLTERKRAEAELAHANRVATMGQLTASIAHEVNQPIAALLINAETAVRWLDRQPPNLEKATPLIDHIIRDGRRAADILSRIRNFSKKAPVRKTSLEMNETILDVIGLTQAVILKNGVLAKMQLSEGLPSILGDRVQLQQVILNLIMNAVEAMSELREGSRELSISTSRVESGSVLVAVSDTGPGLPQAGPKHIFEAFYTTKANGLGMGLSICRSIIEAHGGRLWTTPNEPHGATFLVVLPTEGKPLEALEPSGA